MTTAAPKAFSVRNCVASATVSVEASDTGLGVMISAAVRASSHLRHMRLRVRGPVKFAPRAVNVKRRESLLLDFGGKSHSPQPRRVLAVGLEDGEHRPHRVECDQVRGPSS